MKILTPELAQEMTEKSWTTAESYVGCGWCLWTNKNCQRCPVAVVFEQGATRRACDGILAYRAWQDAPIGRETDAAAEVIYDLLVEKRDELIAAAYNIREGMK